MRKGEGSAQFGECRAHASLDLDGAGIAEVSSGSGFLDHMLRAFARTGSIDLQARSEGSLFRAQTLGSAIGAALDGALAERKGIRRYVSAAIPMDEALAEVALDFSGRPYLVLAGTFRGERVGDFELQEVKAFLEALCNQARLTLHIRFSGENDHHQVESVFKALGMAIRLAAAREGDGVPSTKGVI
jgi:imidazoleglycerol phosphate dehydratase HisB